MSESVNSGSPGTTKPNKSNQKYAIIIAILSVIIIIQFVNTYLNRQEREQLLVEKSTTEEELATTMQRLEEIRAELDQKIADIQRLGGDISELTRAKEEIETELKRTRRANGQVIKELKDRVEGYELLLKNKDAEIERLSKVNTQLLSENTTLKTQKNVLGDSINRLTQTKQELAGKVAIASQLKAENFRIVAVNDRGRERESPFRSRQVGNIKIEFNLAENNVAPVEGKKIMIRIVDQNNQVLFDVARGSGTFLYNGKEEFYTAAQEILFDNTRQKLVYLYDKGSDYNPGTYRLEVYCDDYLMGSGSFVVK
ncbi:MAG: chromosome segregation protein SMC [Cyclobacteriaceae bacterium]|jgi:cell division protein ZapB|nr:chromosome segregation protein SMC [Cyclobacteriaceae bacterium]